MRRWMQRGLAVLGLATVALGATVAVYVQRAMPVTDGTLDLPGAQAPIRIERDAHGIPTIRASSPHDAYFGLGVVHAQDRLWQLETHRRIGSGRLAEAFGEAALGTDRFLRALGVRRAAEAQWAQASPASRAALTAYAAGINAVLSRALRARPPEFLVLGLQPEPWTPVDSMAWGIMMAWDLGGNWRSELNRLQLSATLPVARIDELLPPYPGEAPLPVRDYAALYRELGLHPQKKQLSWQQLPEQAPRSGVEGVGSNNWVLAGSHTRSGKPLLANDPHLHISSPALWYFARLQAPGLDVAGATMPGTPIVVLGQNARVAWGFTNTAPDVQDLYLEAVDRADPTRYRTPDGTAVFETRTERIAVKGKPDVTLTVRSTRHGPVISDAGTLPEATHNGHVLALRWTALDADSDTVAVGLQMMQATTVRDFVSATAAWVAPMQNMVVADADGAIGFVAAGRVPLRKPDNDLYGLAPAPGWDARYDWAGWVPATETPRAFDPARGWIATANHRITAPGYPHFITSEWASPYRQQRIEQLLDAQPRHAIEDLARIQADTTSLAAQRLLPWLRKAAPDHALAAAAQQQLEGFDGTMAADRAAPLIHWAWLHQLRRLLLADEIGADLFDRRFANTSFVDTVAGILERDDAWWCDDKTTPAVETCAQLNTRAMAAALDELSARFGPDPAAWRWGAAHIAQAEHRPFSRVPVLARWFELRTPVGGDTFTVNVSRVLLRADVATGARYQSDHAPSLRALYDLGDRSQSRVMHSSGQSGLVFASGYRDFLQPWAAVQYLPLWPGADAAAAGGVLVVQPGSP
jgi:penicillin G amidase